MIDATTVSAVPATGSKLGESAPDKHPTKRDNGWLFGLKGHIGEDAATRLLHSDRGASSFQWFSGSMDRLNASH